MNENSTVSVVIPTYNSSTTIIQAIESVFNQSYASWEIIVVDDGSTDNTAQVLAPYVSEGKISYLLRENGGPGAARNTGVKHAKGRYVAFLDADDYFHVEKLMQQVKQLSSDPKAIVSYSDAYEVDPFQKAVWNVRQTRAGKLRNGNVLPYLAFRNFITLSSGLVRKSALDSVGGFDESHGVMMVEDYDLWLKLAPLGEFVAIDAPLAFYRTRIVISRKQKRDNHRKVMTVFANRFLASRFGDKGWYAIGYSISFAKFCLHSALLFFHL